MGSGFDLTRIDLSRYDIRRRVRPKVCEEECEAVNLSALTSRIAISEKSSCPSKCLSAILRPEMGCANFMAA